jgi:hypothetical protein
VEATGEGGEELPDEPLDELQQQHRAVDDEAERLTGVCAQCADLLRSPSGSGGTLRRLLASTLTR